MPVALVVAGMLTPVDGAELEEAETRGALGAVAADAGGPALRWFGVRVTLQLGCGNNQGFELLLLVTLGDLGVRGGRGGGQGEEARGHSPGSLGGEVLGSLAELAELLGSRGRHLC